MDVMLSQIHQSQRYTVRFIKARLSVIYLMKTIAAVLSKKTLFFLFCVCVCSLITGIILEKIKL